MNCRTVVANLSSFIDRESGSEMSESILEHIRHCDSCRIEEQDLRSLKQLLSNSQTCQIDPKFEARLQDWMKDPSLNRGSSISVKAASLWILAPATIAVIWIVSESILPTQAVSSTPMKSPISQTVARDQIYDMTESAPLYGAPVLTAVGYAR